MYVKLLYIESMIIFNLIEIHLIHVTYITLLLTYSYMPILIQVLLNISKKKNIVHIDRQYTLLNIGWLYISNEGNNIDEHSY